MAKKNKSKTTPAQEVKAQEEKTEAAETTVAEETAEVKQEEAVVPAAEVESAEKTETKAAENKEPDITVKIQFAGNEYDVCEIREKVEKAYNESVKDAVRSVDIYIKPEDKAAYYVVNSDSSGKIDI